MAALEIRHFRRVTGFDEGFVAGHDEVRQTAAQHRLLAEQIGFALFLEGRLDDAGAAAADRRGVAQRDFEGVARGVLVDRDQARHTGAALIFGAHRVARALRRDHEDVEVGTRFDQLEVDVETVRERQRRTFFEVGGQVIAVQRGLSFVRRQHHDDIGPGGCVCRAEYLETFVFRLPGAAGAFAERDGDFLDAAVAEIEGMGMALAAVADNGHFLAFDQIHIRITVVINSHFSLP